MTEQWHLYGTNDVVTARLGDKGRPIEIGDAEHALALADRIRAEFIPDTSGAPGRVKVRQVWHLSVVPHAVIVLHVQTPHLTAYELEALRDVVSAIEKLEHRLGRRLRGEDV